MDNNASDPCRRENLQRFFLFSEIVKEGACERSADGKAACLKEEKRRELQKEEKERRRKDFDCKLPLFSV